MVIIGESDRWEEERRTAHHHLGDKLCECADDVNAV